MAKHRDAISGSPFLEDSNPTNHGGVSYAEATGLGVRDSTGEVVPNESTSTPLRVTSDIKKPDSTDYIPSKARIKQYQARRKAKMEDQGGKRSRKITGDIKVIREKADYLSPEKSREIVKEREKEIIALAKKIHKSRKEQWKKYQEAKDIVEAAKPEEKLEPKPLLAGAIALVKLGMPPSFKKDICITAARIKVLGLAD